MRRQGIAKQLLNKVCNASGDPVYLDPKPFGEDASMTSEELDRWYKREFFIPVEVDAIQLLRYMPPF